MAVPTGYTDSTLKAYMHAMLGAVATGLGWTVAATDYDEVLNDTLLSYGVDAVTAISGRDNIRKVRLFARREVWRHVVDETAGDFDIKTLAGTMTRSQINAQARRNLLAAEVRLLAYDEEYQVGALEVVYEDPYVAPEADS